MKTQKLKPSKLPFYSKEADKLGVAYDEEGALSKQHGAKQAEVREKIFALALDDDAGISPDGKTRFRTGDVYKVGQMTVMTSPTVDQGKLQSQLSRRLRDLVFVDVVEKQFDEAAFIKLVEDGEIDPAIVTACTVPPVVKQHRVVVEKL